MIYVTGDIHGDARRFEAVGRKLQKGDTLLVCGDFGFLWNGGAVEERLIKKLGKKKYNIAFVDGTHENFDLLNACPVQEWCGGQVHAVSGSLYHLMRGEIYNIEDKRFFVFGGGSTPEKRFYMDAGKWWECELPTHDEMRRAAENLREHEFAVDYILTHEPGPRMGGMQNTELRHLDTFFETISKQVEFKKWYFGALHQDRMITQKHYAVFRHIIPIE